MSPALTNPTLRSSTYYIRDSEPAGPQLRFLRFPAVRARTGLSRSTIWRLEQQGSFPRHRRISKNAVAWLDDEITAWIRSKLDMESEVTRAVGCELTREVVTTEIRHVVTLLMLSVLGWRFVADPSLAAPTRDPAGTRGGRTS